jgi:hypothetical protein
MAMPKLFFISGAVAALHNGGLQPLPSPFMMGLLNQPAIFTQKPFRNHWHQVLSLDSV